MSLDVRSPDLQCRDILLCPAAPLEAAISPGLPASCLFPNNNMKQWSNFIPGLHFIDTDVDEVKQNGVKNPQAITS